MSAGMQVGRLAKKLKNPSQNSKINTPYPNFKTFSPSELLRGMGVLPKNYVYLIKNNYAKRDKNNGQYIDV